MTGNRMGRAWFLGCCALLGCGTGTADDGAGASTASNTATADSTAESPSTDPVANGVGGNAGSAGAGDGSGGTPGADSATNGGTPSGGATPGSGTPDTGGASGAGPVGGIGGTAEPAGIGGALGGAGATSAGGSESGGTSSAGGSSGTSSGGTNSGGTSSGGTNSAGGMGGQGNVEIVDGALFASPDGTPGATGTIEDPTTLPDALSRVNAGETIYLRGGVYVFGTTLDLSGGGSEDAPIALRAYPLDAERPSIDFSGMPESSDNRGLALSGGYWHVYGIDVFGAGDNCMFVSGSHNTVEFSSFSECADTGLQLGNGAADNLILNCDSYFNADSSLENADGFAAKLDVGTGNRFVGCRAWNNLDDGWDGYLRPANDVTTTYEDCWAFDNGKLKDGSVGAGDGNGFKSGGSDDKDLRHNAVYTRCIAAGNVHDGFDHNSNRGSVTILNCAAHDNASNINFGTSNIAASLTVKNTISLGTNGELAATTTDIEGNSWQDGLAAAENDFLSVDTAQLKAPRQRDGSLPDIDYLRLSPDSSLRNAGVDIGLPFDGSAPDIGPFETSE